MNEERVARDNFVLRKWQSDLLLDYAILSRSFQILGFLEKPAGLLEVAENLHMGKPGGNRAFTSENGRSERLEAYS